MELKHIDEFNPRTCISGQVMRINRKIANIFRTYLKPYDITDSQLTILFVLSKHSKLNQKQLSNITVLEKSTLNRNLTRLYNKNYISRENFPLLTISQEGKVFVNNIIPEWEKAMEEVRLIIGFEGEQNLQDLHTKLITPKL